MNSSHTIRIKFIIKNFSNVCDYLLILLQKEVTKHWPEAQIKLEVHEKYWKYEGEVVIVYSLKDKHPLSVYDFIKKTPLEWQYHAPVKYYDEEHKAYFFDEKAIWSRSLDSEDFFLDRCIDWVHIYRFEDAG